MTSDFDESADLVLFEGDTLNLLSQIPDGFVQLVVTSPPYNINKQYESKLDMDDYLAQQEKIIKECVRVLNDKGSICWQVGNYVDNGEIIPLDILLYPIFASLNLHLRNRIIWHFGHGLHASKRFSGRYEVILWFTKGDEYTFNLDAVRVPQKYPGKKYYKGHKKGEYSGNPLGKNPSDVWEIPNVKANHPEKTIHPCQFPIALVQRLTKALSPQNGWILDPFMGVCTTGVAAILDNRKFIGSEINSSYYKIAVERCKEAFNNEIKYRSLDKPIYKPSSNLSVAKKPANFT